MSSPPTINQVALGRFDASARRHQSTVILPDGRGFTPEASDGAQVIVLIASGADTGCSALAFTRDGGLAADLWFATIVEAKAVLAAEFRVTQASWVDVPVDEEDAQAFASRHYNLGETEA